MDTLWQARWVLIEATWVTFQVFVVSALLALCLSFLVGLAQTSHSRVIRYLGFAYGEFFRGISLVVQLFWLYFVLPLFGLTVSAFTASVLGLGLCFGAYGADVVRSGMLAVPSGQREAAATLGLKPLPILVIVELPQALLLMLPPFGNLMVQLLKSTSVTALITIPELTFQAAALNNNMGPSLGVFGFVMMAYYVMSSGVLLLVGMAERRLSVFRSR